MTQPNQTPQQIWTQALRLSDSLNLQTSLIAELAAYLNQPSETIRDRCQNAAIELADLWREVNPTTPAEIEAFYRATDLYLYDLTWWHAGGGDDSVLNQVEVLRLAWQCRAKRVLDFGCGIGSLGLLLAQNGFEMTLAEVNEKLLAYTHWRFTRRDLAATFVNLDETLLPPARFDLIVAIDVFEHLPQPEQTLHQLTQALRSDGTLLIHLPPQADVDHPMHLWHKPQVLYAHLAEAGLWLERLQDTFLILRRGTGPTYRLNQGLELMTTAAGGFLLSRYPLLALRLNPYAFALLTNLGEGQLALAATPSGLSLGVATTFLNDLAQRRLLIKNAPALARTPQVSVIIPAYNRPKETRACVESLTRLDYPADQVEIIVVDDGSEPPLAETLADLPAQVVRPEQGNIGQSAARNMAAHLAQGEILAFIDNDCLATPDWLQKLLPHFFDASLDIVGGRVISPPLTGWVSAYEAVHSPLDMGQQTGQVGPDQVIAYLPACNLLVRRETMLALAGFTPEMVLGEDVDLIWRAITAGAQVYYAPEGEIIHHHRTHLWPMLRRRADYASSEADLQRRHPHAHRVMHLPLTGLLLLLAMLMAFVWWPISVGVFVIALVRLGLELRNKQQQLVKTGVNLPLSLVGRAILQGHGASFYHLGANLTRYYSLPLLLMGLIWWPLLLVLLPLFLVTPLVDYFRLRPSLPLPIYVGLFWLEMVAYQSGVWAGCIRWRTFWPLFPRLEWRR